ncbi:fibroblast growth factor receptor 2-like isoform X2 [Actinia tenebrosa]|uniref:receptor protein-tyrosine kinase n=1 Tax=Actinia tenebrosa TaxID=6105 RepID=A0A6P8IA78_ACTTE|nr:fibroblast growth factor receptor 2-like isoform X2 [Actinia tenebrosa]
MGTPTKRSLLMINCLFALELLMLNSIGTCTAGDSKLKVCVDDFKTCINQPQFKKCTQSFLIPKVNMSIVSRNGQSVRFRCLDFSNINTLLFVPSFTWIKSNHTKEQLDIDNNAFEHIHSHGKKYFFKSSQIRQDLQVQWLTVENVTASDYGLYTCVVCTKYGRHYQSVLFEPLQQDKIFTQSLQTPRPVSNPAVPTSDLTTPTPTFARQKHLHYHQGTTIALFVVGSLLFIVVLLGVLYVLRKKIFKAFYSSELTYPGASQFVEIGVPSQRGSFCDSEANRKLSAATSIASHRNSTSSTAPLMKPRHSSARAPNSGQSQMTYISEVDGTEADVFEVEADESWEIPREHMVLEETIGEGAFGTVMKATAYGLSGKPSKYTVAVKTLRDDAKNQELIDFIAEIETMKNIGHHKNIINMIGTCTTEGPILLVVEHAFHGNLRDFLRNHRCPSTTTDIHFNNNPHKQLEDAPLTIGDLISFSYQSAKGMEYLASKKCIHRDLAARNVLVAEDYVIKIADFGLSRNLNDADYYRKTTNGRLPIMWLSIEALFDQKYTLMSDVWSFGVLLWEIFTLGSTPYPGISPETIFTLLKSGYRMASPQNCLPEIYALMLRCWSEKVTDRPIMEEIAKELDYFLASSTSVDYLDIIAQSMDDLSPNNSEEKIQNINTDETNV